MRSFYDYVEKTETCWLWKSWITHGYGRFKLGDNVIQAHHYTYMEKYGEIPEGLTIDHLCRVKNCVNPEHLEAVSPAENTLRAWAARYELDLEKHREPGASHLKLCLRGHKKVRDSKGVFFCRACKDIAYDKVFGKSKREREWVLKNFPPKNSVSPVEK